mgnify:CR=1 FL=1|jgi:hypothetical protein
MDQEVLPGRTQESVVLSIRCHIFRNNAEIVCVGDGWGDAKRCGGRAHASVSAFNYIPASGSSGNWSRRFLCGSKGINS